MNIIKYCNIREVNFAPIFISLENIVSIESALHVLISMVADIRSMSYGSFLLGLFACIYSLLCLAISLDANIKNFVFDCFSS